MTAHTHCTSCGVKFAFFGRSDTGNGLCQPCANDQHEAQTSPAKQAEIDTRRATLAEVASVVVTTETTIVEPFTRLGVVSADVVYGQHIGKDLLQGVRDVVGGRSLALQKLLRESREAALQELQAEAHALGANAVIAVTFTVTKMDGGVGITGMNLVSAVGTAVRI
jgi:uncharacterized protein YbjQ (UPF0145 family)